MTDENQLERIWKKAVGLIKVLSQHLPGGTEESNEKVRTAYVLFEIQTEHPPNMGLGCYHYVNLSGPLFATFSQSIEFKP
jgi:hypothetical protein